MASTNVSSCLLFQWRQNANLCRQFAHSPFAVLSAIQGIKYATPKINQSKACGYFPLLFIGSTWLDIGFSLAAVVVVVSSIILVFLFSLQRMGTTKVGFLFAPVVLVWFVCIGILGLYNIIKHDPTVLKALSPHHIMKYFIRNKKEAWVSLGGIVLCVTGNFIETLPV